MFRALKTEENVGRQTHNTHGLKNEGLSTHFVESEKQSGSKFIFEPRARIREQKKPPRKWKAFEKTVTECMALSRLASLANPFFGLSCRPGMSVTQMLGADTVNIDSAYLHPEIWRKQKGHP